MKTQYVRRVRDDSANIRRSYMMQLLCSVLMSDARVQVFTDGQLVDQTTNAVQITVGDGQLL